MSEEEMVEYSSLSREQLEARLKVAEDVCVLVGWTATVGGERGDALTQLWMTWSAMSGVPADPDSHPELDALVPKLASQRRRTRERVLHRIAGDAGPDNAS